MHWASPLKGGFCASRGQERSEETEEGLSREQRCGPGVWATAVSPPHPGGNDLDGLACARL